MIPAMPRDLGIGAVRLLFAICLSWYLGMGEAVLRRDPALVWGLEITTALLSWERGRACALLGPGSALAVPNNLPLQSFGNSTALWESPSPNPH